MFKMENLILNQKNHLELEKRNFLIAISHFAENIPDDYIQINGRPRFNFKDVLKSLLIMSFHGMSYRRANSDLLLANELRIIEEVPKRSTLNKYMTTRWLRGYLGNLIQLSAMPFISQEDTVIVDSTWFGFKMYFGGYNKKPHIIRNKNPMSKCIKVHIGCLKNSRIIAYAKTTDGSTHDNPIFKKIISRIIKNGFNINRCIADAGYLSKDNYALCEDLGIRNIFIDFKKNVVGKNPKSFAWKNAFNMYKENPDIWHENYRYRVLVEGIFSVIKRKWLNYIRSRKTTARYNELLLKCLCYNLTIIGKGI